MAEPLGAIGVAHHGAGENIAYDPNGFRDFGAWEKIMCSSDGGTFNRNEF